MKTTFLAFFLFVVILLPLVLGHEGERHSIFEWDSLQHLITLGIAVIVVVLGIISLPKTLSSNLIIAGIITIGLSHLAEVLVVSFEIFQLTGENLESLEHLLIMAGLLIIGFGFHLKRA